MVKNQLKTLMLWVIAVVVLMYMAQCHIFKTVWSENELIIARENRHLQEKLNAAEIDKFIRLWPQYKELKLKALPNKSLSITEKQTPDWKTNIWFVYHQQDVERFFYVRQRLEELLRKIAIKRNASAVIKQMQENQNELARDMVEQHERRIASLHLNEQEVALIIEREEDLKQLFRLYP